MVYGDVVDRGIVKDRIEITEFMRDINTIIYLIDIIISFDKTKKFKNTTLKSTMQMTGVKRDRLFVEELLQAQCIIPVRLLSGDSNSIHKMSLFENVYFEFPKDKGDDVCVYTSKQEIPKEILKSIQNA